jgi:hypothetical protein
VIASRDDAPEGAGTVIAGTLRPEDLVPAFLAALDERIEDASFDEGADAPARVQALDALQDRLGDLERRCAEPGYFDGEDPTWDLEWLDEALNDYAPKGCRFGAHEGDGRDFGFWPMEDDDE